MKTFQISIACLTAALMACQAQSGETSIKKINTTELQVLMSEDIQLVDVRTAGEVAEGLIKGATWINFRDTDFVTRMDQLDKDRPVVLYCASGGRSAAGAKKVATLGFKEIYDYTDGATGWKAAGGELVKE